MWPSVPTADGFGPTMYIRAVAMNEASSAPTKYFRTENRRLTFRECWWLAPGWRVLFLWIPKVLRIPLELGAGLPAPRPFEERWVDPASLPPEVREVLDVKARGLMKLGFDLCHYHVLVGSLMTSESGGCYMVHASGEIVATILFARNYADNGSTNEGEVTAFLTPKLDGSMLITTNQAQKLESSPANEVLHQPGAFAETLLASHQERLAAVRALGKLLPRRITETPELAQLVDAHEQRSFDFHVRRGVWVPMTAPQVERMRQKRENFDARRAAAREESPPGEEIDIEPAFMRSGGSTEHVIAEDVIRALAAREQPARGIWGNHIGLLILSLAVFAAVGIYRWRWQTVATIIVVLLFHEAGHYVAMRGFGYRNVKMFFIPGLGAAVSGHARFMPGYKRVIVALMGPVPGIIAGGVCCFVGYRTDSAGWNLAATVLVLLNGFNLAPILPFDGGRVVDDAVFCRDPWLRAGFGVLAGALLMLVAFWSGMLIFLLLGVVVLLAVPRGFRHDMMARKLKNMGVRPIPDKTVGVDRMELIVREVAATKKKPIDPRALKAEVMGVYDRWNVEPPSFFASASLLAVYALSLLAAIVLLYLAIVFRPPGSPTFLEVPGTESKERGP
jgi:Zn-dependent protease